MDTYTFWTLIERAQQASKGSIDKQLDLLTKTLLQLPNEDIMEFDRILWEMMAQAYRADLWEAAYVIGCGCSDDGFHEFRSWLIAQGKAIFEDALTDPETLADVVVADHRWDTQDGRMSEIASNTYEIKTGEWKVLVGYTVPQVLTRKLDPEDKLKSKFPRIVSKLGDCSE